MNQSATDDAPGRAIPPYDDERTDERDAGQRSGYTHTSAAKYWERESRPPEGKSNGET
jgi:hypothetical protein